jgi:23S rRNA (uracil1939-C5)-methyltransferase
MLKERYLTGTMHKIAGKDALEGVHFSSIVPSPDIFYYRNKMEFAFGKENGKTVLGLREGFSPGRDYRKNTVALSECGYSAAW